MQKISIFLLVLAGRPTASLSAFAPSRRSEELKSQTPESLLEASLAAAVATRSSPPFAVFVLFFLFEASVWPIWAAGGSIESYIEPLPGATAHPGSLRLQNSTIEAD
jgi:hypothetical protein